MKATNEMRLLTDYVHQQVGDGLKMNQVGMFIWEREDFLRYVYRLNFKLNLDDKGVAFWKESAPALYDEICNWLDSEKGSLYAAEIIRVKILKLLHLEDWI